MENKLLADDTVTYKVELDDSDLGSQLESVRQRIDQAMSTSAIRPVEVTQSSSIPNFDFSAPPVTTSFSSQLDSHFWENIGTNARSDLYGTVGMMNDKLNSVMATSYGAMQQGIQDFRGMTGMHDATFSIPHTADPGFFNDVIRATTPFYGGFEYTGPVTPGMMRRQSHARLNQKLFDTATGLGFSGLGTAVGGVVGLGIGGPVGAFEGAMTGMVVGGVVDFAADIFTRAAVERDQMGEGLYSISRASGSGLHIGEAKALAGDIQKMYSSIENRAAGFNVVSAEEGILSFANAGGYTNVRGAEEFKRVTKELLENYKQVAADLQVSFDEATAFMGGLSQRFISPSTASGISAQIRTVAAMSGQSPNEIAQFADQAAAMFRGTGIGPEAGYMMALDSRYQAERMMTFGNTTTRQLIADFGGVEGATVNLMSNLTKWGMSEEGLLALAAAQGGYNGSGGIAGMLSAGAGLIASDPAMLLALRSEQGRLVGEMAKDGPNELLYRSLDSRIELLKTAMPGAKDKNGKVYWDVLAGQIAGDYGIAQQEADLWVASAYYGANGPNIQDRSVENSYNILKREADIIETPNAIQRVWYGAGKWVEDTFFDVGWANRRRDSIRGTAQDITDSISEFFTGKQITRLDRAIKNDVYQRDYEKFAAPDSPYSIQLNKAVQNILDNSETPQVQKLLQQAALSELNDYVQNKVTTIDEQMIRYATSGTPEQHQALLTGFAMHTFGMTDSARKAVIEDVRDFRLGHTASQTLSYINEGVDSGIVTVNREGTLYKTAWQEASTNADFSTVTAGMTAKQARDAFATSIWGKSYANLTSDQKAAMRDYSRLDESVEKKLEVLSISGPVISNRAKAERAAIASEAASAREEAIRAGSTIVDTGGAEVINELHKLGVTHLLLTKEDIRGDLEELNNRLISGLTDGSTTIETIRGEYQEMEKRGENLSFNEKRHLAARKGLVSASDKSKYAEALKYATFAEVRKVQNTERERMAEDYGVNQLEEGPLKESLLNYIDTRVVKGILMDDTIIHGGKIDVSRLQDLQQGMIADFMRAGMKDSEMETLRVKMESGLSATGKISGRDLAAVGSSTAPVEESRKLLFETLNRQLNSLEGIRVTVTPGDGSTWDPLRANLENIKKESAAKYSLPHKIN
ncbi:MAG TPA: hypothetical protein PKN48_00465 [Bacteroidales bacterium]|nr:hypothetical protein [Bacteroidales bacterium]